jgi:hypothetical protein
MQRTLNCCAIAIMSALAAAMPAAAQEFALKGLITVSKFGESGSEPNAWDDRLTATGFGGHVRFRFGAFALQPELQVVTRGAEISVATSEEEEEQLRMEYLELPVLLVFPVRVGRLEPYAFGGGMVALESRCRYVVKESGLRSNFGCDSSSGAGQVFDRRKADYGLVGGAGASYRVGSGRVLLEARHTWGFRNVAAAPATLELRHRTFTIGIGYTINLADNR